jgi:hypothetical protein
MKRHSDGGNHHQDYKLWCLALYVARDLPKAKRSESPTGLRGIPDKQIRRSWLSRYEERRGPQPQFRQLVMDLYKQLASGETPEYTGEYLDCLRGNKI